tara:strand:+ start:47348 stop:47641 length:294 start_codon:yes stop_codon:yes gene_type:complete
MRTARRPVTAARLRPPVTRLVVAARRLMPARALPLLRDLAMRRLCARLVLSRVKRCDCSWQATTEASSFVPVHPSVAVAAVFVVLGRDAATVPTVRR